jgi:hypothetical protein
MDWVPYFRVIDSIIFIFLKFSSGFQENGFLIYGIEWMIIANNRGSLWEWVVIKDSKVGKSSRHRGRPTQKKPSENIAG